MGGVVMTSAIKVYPVGVVRKQLQRVWLEIDPAYAPALIGLENYSHINVFYWFHENDQSEQRRILQVHPRGDQNNPLTGVFATHAPVRPNLIALTRCRLKTIHSGRVYLETIDARDGSPVLDIKGYIPGDADEPFTVPEWV
jgi:tRNA-Thr(GGU) m(6)t(6)A37 methyltransferase TsaA